MNADLIRVFGTFSTHAHIYYYHSVNTHLWVVHCSAFRSGQIWPNDKYPELDGLNCVYADDITEWTHLLNSNGFMLPFNDMLFASNVPTLICKWHIVWQLLYVHRMTKIIFVWAYPARIRFDK